MMVQSDASPLPGNGIIYGIQGTRLFLRGLGRLCVSSLGSCFQRITDLVREHAIVSVIFDLERCEYLDSTILGSLVGLHKLLGHQGALYIHHPSPEAFQLLAVMGIDRLLGTTQNEPEPVFPEAMEALETEEKVRVGDLLRAHELLCELSSENQLRFATLNRVLQNKLLHNG